jgi:AcrR family transcriptional regulator
MDGDWRFVSRIEDFLDSEGWLVGDGTAGWVGHYLAGADHGTISDRHQNGAAAHSEQAAGPAASSAGAVSDVELDADELPPEAGFFPITPDMPTQDRLIFAAMELFLKQGYSATGVKQILDRAGAKSGSLYYFFPTKEDLLLAVLEKYKELLYPDVMQPVFDRVSDPIERIFGVLDGYRQMLTMTHCTLGCPIGNLALELSDTHPAARELICDNFDGWKACIAQCIREASGRFPDDVDAKEIASFVLTVMEGGMMQAKSYKTLEPFDSAVTQLRDYFDRLLADGSDWSRPK